MSRGSVAGGPDPTIVRLHPIRGPAVVYGTLVIIIVVVVVLGVVSNVGGGQIAIAVVLTVGGLALATFLGYLTLALVIPALEANATGVRCRISWRKTVNAQWREVAIEIDAEDPPGRLRLKINGEPMPIDAQFWRGFRDFAILVASTPEAARTMSPAARREVRRFLHLTG